MSYYPILSEPLTSWINPSSHSHSRGKQSEHKTKGKSLDLGLSRRSYQRGLDFRSLFWSIHARIGLETIVLDSGTGYRLALWRAKKESFPT